MSKAAKSVSSRSSPCSRRRPLVDGARRIAAVVGAATVMTAGSSGAAMAQAFGPAIELYSRAEFGGVSVRLQGDEPRLAARGFDKRTSSVVVNSGVWQLCVDADYRAGCRNYGPGRYADLGPGMAGQVSSARPFRPQRERVAAAPTGPVPPPPSPLPPAGPPALPSRGAVPIVPAPPSPVVSVPVAETSGLTLYSETDFGGERYGIVADTPSFQGGSFDNRAASVVVYQGTWEICSEPQYGGSCAVYRPGRYPRMGGLSGQASSLRRVP